MSCINFSNNKMLKKNLLTFYSLLIEVARDLVCGSNVFYEFVGLKGHNGSVIYSVILAVLVYTVLQGFRGIGKGLLCNSPMKHAHIHRSLTEGLHLTFTSI